jgi:hypothetical protein
VLFGWYSIGLVLGFFAYIAVGLLLYGKQEVQPWRIEKMPPKKPLNLFPRPSLLVGQSQDLRKNAKSGN